MTGFSAAQTRDRAVLSIAGSDPAGGAGIQADLKTLTALGVYAAAAITCITVQNTLGVRYFVPLEPQLVADQIRAVLDDLPVSHVKIGMLGTAGIARAVAAALADFPGEIILDPVLVAGSGQDLSRQGFLAALAADLLPKVTALTPNLPELATLCGLEPAQLTPDDPAGEQDPEAPPDSDSQGGPARQPDPAGPLCPPAGLPAPLAAAIAKLFAQSPRLRAVILTGAHHRPDSALIRDLLWQRPGPAGKICCREFRHPRRKSANLHGTGCTFASALAAFHLLTGSYPEALPRTITFMDRVIAAGSALHLGHGNGPLGHHIDVQQHRIC